MEKENINNKMIGYKEVMEIFNCSETTARRKIIYLQKELTNRTGVPKECQIAGMISRKFFYEIYDI